MRHYALIAVTSCLVAACTLPTPTPNVAAPAAASPSTIERLLTAELAKDNRGGLTAGILQHGELVWTRSWGLADEAHHQPMRNDSVFPIASATKLVTGIMLLQLVERGRVHLSDPVERFVPEIRSIENPFPWAPPITLVQLATMTGGIERGLGVRDQDKAAVRAANTWEDKMAATLPSIKVAYEPGTANRYSNTGYCILGLALSRAAQRPFTEYVRTEILTPLGMHDTSFAITPELAPRLVGGYSLQRPGLPAEPAFNSETLLLLPAAGLVSTVEDLAKLMRFQTGHGPESVLSSTTLRASYQLLVSSDGSLDYGDGVGFASVRNPGSKLTALGHGGSFPEGFLASYEFDGATGNGVILLANTTAGQAKYKLLARKILEILAPDSAGGSGLPPLEEH